MISKIQFSLLLLILSQAISASVRVYNYSPEVKSSSRYLLKAEGQSVFVIDNPVPAAFASFEADGAVQIEIECWQDIKWVDVRPLKAGIKPVIKNNKIFFTIPSPGNYCVEINGKTEFPLFIFANPPEVKPDKSNPDVIYFEAGKIHKPGIISPKSNQQVYIEGGAFVFGAITATDVENVKISGYGILDGTFNNQSTDNTIKRTSFAGETYTMPKRYQRFIEFFDSKNLTIEGIILNNGTSWQVVPINCDNVTIQHLKIISDNPSDDGVDIVRSRKVRVSDCFIRTKDDCVVIKSFLNYPDSVIVDDVLVEKCIFWNALWGNGLEIGFELLSDEVKNITFNDCDLIHVESGAVLSIHNSGKSTVKNVLFKNIRIEDARQKLFDLAIFRSRYSLDGSSDSQYISRNYLLGAWDGVLKVPEKDREYHAQFRGKIENIKFDGIYIQGFFPFSIISGFDNDHKIKNVTFNNIYVNGQKINSLDDMKLFQEYSENIFINIQ